MVQKEGGSSALYLSCKEFRDWFIKHTWKKSYLLDRIIFAACLETTSHCFVDLVCRCGLEKRTMHFAIFSIKCSSHVGYLPS